MEREREREREREINDPHQNKIIADFVEYFWRINKSKHLSLCKDIIIVSIEIIIKITKFVDKFIRTS